MMKTSNRQPAGQKLKSGQKGGAAPAAYSTSRYIWMGAAIGLYFGWFFRPVRDPNLFIVIGLSFLIALVLFGFNLFKKERLSFGRLLMQIPVNMIQYALILSILELRHFAFDWGGRLAVVIFTGLMGMLSGYWLAYRENRVSL